MLTVLGSKVNISGGGLGGDLYDHLMSMRIFALVMSYDNYEENGMTWNCYLISHKPICMCHILQEVGAKRKLSK